MPYLFVKALFIAYTLVAQRIGHVALNGEWKWSRILQYETNLLAHPVSLLLGDVGLFKKNASAPTGPVRQFDSSINA